MHWALDPRHPATRAGWRCGLAFGAVHVAYALVNNLNDLDAAGNALLNRGLLIALVAVFGVAGWAGARATGAVRAGVQASLLTWLVSSVIGLAALWMVTLAFADQIGRHAFMQQDFARSGSPDLRTFVIEDALGATVFGTAAMLVAVTLCSALGALAARTLRRQPALA